MSKYLHHSLKVLLLLFCNNIIIFTAEKELKYMEKSSSNIHPFSIITLMSFGGVYVKYLSADKNKHITIIDDQSILIDSGHKEQLLLDNVDSINENKQDFLIYSQEESIINEETLILKQFLDLEEKDIIKEELTEEMKEFLYLKKELIINEEPLITEQSLDLEQKDIIKEELTEEMKEFLNQHQLKLSINFPQIYSYKLFSFDKEFSWSVKTVHNNEESNEDILCNKDIIHLIMSLKKDNSSLGNQRINAMNILLEYLKNNSTERSSIDNKAIVKCVKDIKSLFEYMEISSNYYNTEASLNFHKLFFNNIFNEEEIKKNYIENNLNILEFTELITQRMSIDTHHILPFYSMFHHNEQGEYFNYNISVMLQFALYDTILDGKKLTNGQLDSLSVFSQQLKLLTSKEKAIIMKILYIFLYQTKKPTMDEFIQLIKNIDCAKINLNKNPFQIEALAMIFHIKDHSSIPQSILNLSLQEFSDVLDKQYIK